MKKKKMKVSTKQDKKKYKLQIEMNDEVFKCETDDLRKSILKFAPQVLKTMIKFRIEKDGKVCERIYNAISGRMLFKQNIMLEVFINRLIFK